MTEAEVIDLVRAKIKAAGSLRALAREWDIQPSFLSNLVTGRRDCRPGPKVLDRLGLKRIVTYQPRCASRSAAAAR